MDTSLRVLVLAAGASARHGADKLLASVGVSTLLGRTLELVLEHALAAQVRVVVRPRDDERRNVAMAHGVTAVTAEQAARGLRWSLHAGFDACPAESQGAIILLGDSPDCARMLGSVIDAAQREPHSAVGVERHPFLPHPVYLPRMLWPPPPTSDDDSGLRELTEAIGRWIVDPGPRPIDVDTPGDLDDLRRALQP